MIYRVHHFNFGTIRDFPNRADADAFVERAHFDAVIYKIEDGQDAERVATFSAIRGWYDESRLWPR